MKYYKMKTNQEILDEFGGIIINDIYDDSIKYFNQFGLAVLTALAGLIVWKFRIMRKARIRETYNPDDERDISKSK